MRTLLTIMLMALATAGIAAEPSIVHQEVASDWRFRAAGPGQAYGELEFTALGRAYRVELAPNARLGAQLAAAGFRRPPSSLTLFAGHVVGAAGSWVRLAHGESGWSGLIWDGADLVVVDTAAAVSGMTETPVAAKGGAPVLYRAEDLRIPDDAISCGSAPLVTGGALVGKAAYEGLVQELKTVADRVVDIAMIGDADFAARHPLDPEGALATRLNNIDGIFSEQVGVTLNVTQFRVFDPVGDPLTSSTDARTLLDDLGRYKLAEPELRPLGLVHLYTGRDLDGTTAGIAYTAGICRSQFGAGLSEGRRTIFTDTLIAAHEIGHNFGAPHDGEEGSPCQGTPETFLMAPRINNSSTFSSCSLEQIAAELAGTTCLKEAAVADLSLTIDGPQTPVADGSSFAVDITATNSGTEAASGVMLVMELPPSLSFQSGGPSCFAAAGGAECDLGTIAAGAAATVSPTLRAQSPGQATIRAAVTAENDADPSNNSNSLTVSVEPAVDLAIALDAPATLAQDTVTDLLLRVDNLSAASASAVVVDVDIAANLAVENLATGAFDCTVVSGGVSCSTNTLAGGARSDVTMSLRGSATGSARILARVTANESDPVTGNNETARSIEVRQVSSASTPAPGAASGGGSGHGAWLMIIGGIGLIRRLRHRARPDGPWAMQAYHCQPDSA